MHLPGAAYTSLQLTITWLRATPNGWARFIASSVLTVGCIQNDMDDFERQTAYDADITYGTNNEFGFDYLRDNMKFDLATCVQHGHYHAVVDEVDSILIDEARTPLIISGPSDESTDKYYQANAIIPQLIRGEELEENKKTGDYVVDEKNHSAVLTEEGVDKAERLLGVGNLYDPGNMELLHCVEQALKAHTLYRLDHQYVVQDGEVIIVDDFTGRLMKGRRWSDGLHQAVEAKEGVKIERENQTLATITLQNYFRLYEKLSGMTGTAETEAAEFHSTYKLDVIVIPTHMPMVRKDNPDVIYRTLPEKWDAVVEEIKDLHEKGQPVLVGTVSVENSELIARKLQRIGVPHNVLNAKYHEREAEIVAQAGRKGMVTIATNMAGRGTDILLGGNPDFMTREFLKEQEVDPDEATESQWQRGIPEGQTHRRSRTQGSRVARRPAHSRHRTSRIAPHRQSVTRPRRPSGRSWIVALLPFTRRRSDAHLCRRQGQGLDAAAGNGRRRCHRVQDGFQAHRVRAEISRRPQL